MRGAHWPLRLAAGQGKLRGDARTQQELLLRPTVQRCRHLSPLRPLTGCAEASLAPQHPRALLAWKMCTTAVCPPHPHAPTPSFHLAAAPVAVFLPMRTTPLAP